MKPSMCTVTGVLVAAGFALPNAGLAQKYVGWGPPIEVVVATAPTPTRADQKWHLVYELNVTNFSGRTQWLERVDVIADAPGLGTLLSYQGLDLANSVVHSTGPMPTLDQRARIDDGHRVVVYLWATFEQLPDRDFGVRHTLMFGAGDSTPRQTIRLETGSTRVSSQPAIQIAPPLRDGPWLVAAGPGNGESDYHRRYSTVIEGRIVNPQRFAIDFNKVYEDGRTWHTDSTVNTNYAGYGAEVLAVSEGVVTGVKDGIPENTPGSRVREVENITPETAGGNWVIIDLGRGQFAYFAHLQPGSIRVRPGQRVQRGQVLGLVGNSGNSNGPHLHFHVADAGSPFGAQGLPYAFSSFTIFGIYGKWPGEARADPVTSEIPLAKLLVAFPK